MYGIIIAGLVGLMIGGGFYLLLPSEEREKGFLQVYAAKMNRQLKMNFKMKQENNLLAGTSFYLDRNIYNMARLAALGLMLLISAAMRNALPASIGVVLYACSYPQEKSKKGKALPFSYVVATVRKKEKEKKDDELIDAMALLKNLMVLQKNNPIGADVIIDYLATNSNITKPAFLQLLNKLRLNKKREAEDVFAKIIGTELAKEIGHLLCQLDELNPAELEENLITKQNYVRELRKTKQIRHAQNVSDALYLPVVMTVFMVFLNFIIVVYWIEQRENLMMLFN